MQNNNGNNSLLYTQFVPPQANHLNSIAWLGSCKTVSTTTTLPLEGQLPLLLLKHVTNVLTAVLNKAPLVLPRTLGP